MLKINTNNLAEMTWASPGGKFAGAGKEISEALGRKPHSTDLNERHPFDVGDFPDSAGEVAVSVSFAQCAVGILSCDFRARDRPR